VPAARRGEVSNVSGAEREVEGSDWLTATGKPIALVTVVLPGGWLAYPSSCLFDQGRHGETCHPVVLGRATEG